MNVPENYFDPQRLNPEFESLGHYLPEHDAEALAALRRLVVDKFTGTIQIAEIGSFVGTSALLFAYPYNCDVVVHCIDTWEGTPTDPDDRINKLYRKRDIMQLFLDNTAPAPGVRPYRLSSAEATIKFRDESLHLVFIDGDHTYEAVQQDIALWKPKVMPGGFLCGHDYGVFSGVTRAADNETFDGVMGTVWWKEIQSEEM